MKLSITLDMMNNARSASGGRREETNFEKLLQRLRNPIFVTPPRHRPHQCLWSLESTLDVVGLRYSRRMEKSDNI